MMTMIKHRVQHNQCPVDQQEIPPTTVVEETPIESREQEQEIVHD